jgi:hypothetical protein
MTGRYNGDTVPTAVRNEAWKTTDDLNILSFTTQAEEFVSSLQRIHTAVQYRSAKKATSRHLRAKEDGKMFDYLNMNVILSGKKRQKYLSLGCFESVQEKYGQ